MLYAGYCISIISSTATVLTAPSICKKNGNSFFSPPYMNLDHLALTVLSAFLHKELPIAPNKDTVSLIMQKTNIFIIFYELITRELLAKCETKSMFYFTGIFRNV